MDPAYDDVDAEGELELDGGGGGGMTLVSPGGLEGLGLAPPPSSASLAAGAGVGKRYRPAPAKTFQCRGFGECRMVFSRSEHLARHIRKHTGERPFTCHCSKQFSRLDNLRQHAQTVHADKAAQNEAMMRELTSLHASMTAGGAPSTGGSNTSNANGDSNTNGSGGTSPTAAMPKRAAAKRARASASGNANATNTSTTTNTTSTSPTGNNTSSPTSPTHANGQDAAVKREPDEESVVVQRPRPGTSTGYEGAAYGGMEMEMGGGGRRGSGEHGGGGYMDVDETHPHAHAANPSPPPPGGGARSFRGPYPPAFDRPGQSFLGPAHAHGNTNSHSGGSGQSFRGHPFARRSPPALTPSPPVPSANGNANGLSPNRISTGSAFPAGGPFSSTNRPFSSGNGAFSAANDGPIFAFSTPNPGPAFPANGAAPFSSSSGSRPSTGNGARLPPLSAVVSAAAFRPSSGHGLPAPGSSGSILLPNSLTLRRPSTGDWEWDAWSVRPGTAPGKLATAAAAVADDSPFSFHPPEPPAASAFGFGGNPRKRAFGGPDGPYGAHPDDDSSGGGGAEYGSDSRPASRRLSVMELCNDDAAERPTSAVGVSALRGGSAEREREQQRPTTTNGLVSRASALVLHDRDQQRGEHEPRQHAGEQHVAADRVAAGASRSRAGSVRGGRSRAGSVRGRDAAAPGGAAAGGARAGTGGRGDGGVPGAAAGAGGAFFSSPAAGAGAGAAHRGGALSSAADAAAPSAAAVSRPVRAPASPGARDEHGGPDGARHGHHGGLPSAPALSAYGRLSLSPPAARSGLAGAGLPGGFGGVPPHRSGSADGPPRGGLPGIAVLAGLPAPAYAAGLPPLRGDAFRGGGLHRRFGSDDAIPQHDAGVRYAPGGRAEVREFTGAGHGPGPAGYEYEHEHGHRVGGGRGGGMRV